MFESKYSKVLTIILIIVIIAVLGLLGFLAYNYYQNYIISKDTAAFVDDFQGEVQDGEANDTGKESFSSLCFRIKERQTMINIFSYNLG